MSGGRWTRQDKHAGGVALIFLGIAAMGVAWEAFQGNFSISASGLTPTEAGLLGFIALVAGAFVLVLY